LKSMAQVELSFTSPSPAVPEFTHERSVTSAVERARARTISATPLLLTVTEVAHRLGCGRTLVYDLIGSGQLETVKLGRLRRVPTEAVDVLVRQLRAVSGSGLGDPSRGDSNFDSYGSECGRSITDPVRAATDAPEYEKDVCGPQRTRQSRPLNPKVQGSNP